jgi:hypothetical protein
MDLLATSARCERRMFRREGEVFFFGTAMTQTFFA